MNTLWTFGDSMTFGHGCREDCPNNQYYKEYKEEGDDIWPNILADKLKLDVINLGKCGASNDYIIDSIIDNFDKIIENDYVIIGKTFHERFDIPKKESNQLQTIFGEIEDYSKDDWWIHWTNETGRSEEEIETIINFIYYYADNRLYEERQNKRYNFLKNLLENKNVNILLWKVEEPITKRMERIDVATNFKIKDKHFSFKGHKLFSEYLYNKITLDKKII